MTKMTMFDEIKVKEKYGLEPWQIVDYKALVGTRRITIRSDRNRSKTAARFKQYNTLEESTNT